MVLFNITDSYTHTMCVQEIHNYCFAMHFVLHVCHVRMLVITSHVH